MKRKKITLEEARRMALAILEEREKDRIAFAREEAEAYDDLLEIHSEPMYKGTAKLVHSW